MKAGKEREDERLEMNDRREEKRRIRVGGKSEGKREGKQGKRKGSEVKRGKVIKEGNESHYLLLIHGRCHSCHSQ